MKKLKLITFVFSALMALIGLLAACSKNCPLSIGDRVVSVENKKYGTVKSIGTGAWTLDCTCVVLHDDGSWSESQSPNGDGYYDSDRKYVRNWMYRKVD
ncbi:MAG: hypothetical protein ABJM39_09565 [Porticoccus sp.]|uniref:hypothetical protein n=1 Tax=Porticoccus sp. TaxID=2024853 RepID=UPI0032992711